MAEESFSIGLDTSPLDEGAKKVENTFNNIGKAGEQAGKKIDDAMNKASQSVDGVGGTADNVTNSINKNADAIKKAQAEYAKFVKSARDGIQSVSEDILEMATPTNVDELIGQTQQVIRANKASIKEIEEEYQRLNELAGSTWEDGNYDLSQMYIDQRNGLKDIIAEYKKASAQADKYASELVDLDDAMKADAEAEKQWKQEQEHPEMVNTTEKVKALKDELKNILNQMALLKETGKGDSDTYKGLQERAEAIRNAFKVTVEHTESMRSRMAQIREQLSQMQLNGQVGTDEYNKLAKELGTISDAYSDARKQQQIFANDNGGIKAVQEGLQGVSGAVNTLAGAWGLLTGEEEDFQKVTAKVSSVMAITNGVMQVANSLNKDSYVRTKLWASVQSAFATATNKVSQCFRAMGVSAKTADTSAKALVGTLSFGLAVAIPVVIGLIDSFNSKQEESAQKAKEAKEAYEQQQEAIEAFRHSLDIDFMNESATNYHSRNIKNIINDAENGTNAIAKLRDELGSLLNNEYQQGQLGMKDAFKWNSGDIDDLLQNKSILKKIQEDYFSAYLERTEKEKNIKYGETLEQSVIDDIKQKSEQYIATLKQYIVAIEGVQSDEKKKAEKATEESKKTAEKQRKQAESDHNALIKQKQNALKQIADFDKKETNEIANHAIEMKEMQNKSSLEGLALELANIETNKEKTKEAIRQSEQAKLDEYKKRAYEQYVSNYNGKAGKQMTYEQWDKQNGSNYSLPTSVKAYFDAKQKQADTDANKQRETTLKNALSEYKTYYEQLVDIEEKYAKKDKELRENAGMTDEQAEMMNKSKENEEADVATKFASDKKEYQQFIAVIGNMTIAQAENELSKLSDSLKKVNISDKDQANTVLMLIAKIQALKDQIKELNKDEAELEANQAKLFGKKINTKAWNAVGDSVADLGDAFGDLAQNSSGAIKNISEGAEQFLNSTSTIIKGIVSLSEISSQQIQNVSKTAVQAIKAMEYASVILTIISAVMSLIQTFTNSSDTSTEDASQFASDLRTLQDELKRTKIEALMDNDNTSSIFSNNLWNQSKKNIEASTEALSNLNDKMAEYKDTMISGTQRNLRVAQNQYNEAIQIREYSTARQWQEYIDKYTSDLELYTNNSFDKIVANAETKFGKLGDVFPELFDENGTYGFDLDALKAFVEDGGEVYSSLGTYVRDTLKAIVDYQEDYEDACTNIKDYLEDVFGDLGDSIMDALVDAFEAGTDSAQQFADATTDCIGTMLETFEKQMIYNNVFQRFFDEASEQMQQVAMTDNSSTFSDTWENYKKQAEEAMATGNQEMLRTVASATQVVFGENLASMLSKTDNELSDMFSLMGDEYKMAQYTDILSTLTEQVTGAQDEANDLLTIAQQMAEKYGFDLFNGDEDSASASKSNALTSVTQDSIDEMNGRLTAIQGHTYNMWQNSNMMIDITNGILVNVSQINSNTQRLSAIESTLSDMNTRGIRIRN